MLGVSGIPALFFFVMLFTIPRSPRWLAKMSRIEEARSVLVEIGEENVEGELQDIVRSIEADRRSGEERLFQRKFAFPFSLPIALAAFNQLSGINAILYYLNDIFARAGFSKVIGRPASGLDWVYQPDFRDYRDVDHRQGWDAGPSADRLRWLRDLPCGCGAVFISNTHGDLLVWLLVGFIAFFSFSQGAVIWVFLSEVFPTVCALKDKASAALLTGS